MPRSTGILVLRRRGCLAEDVNRMVCHCFTLDQQQKITKSKYIPNKGYAVLDESYSDDIINAAEEEGIFDTTLGCRKGNAGQPSPVRAMMPPK